MAASQGRVRSANTREGMAFDILIIDDEADIRHLIAGILKMKDMNARRLEPAEAFDAIGNDSPT